MRSVDEHQTDETVWSVEHQELQQRDSQQQQKCSRVWLCVFREQECWSDALVVVVVAGQVLGLRATQHHHSTHH